MTGRDWVPGSSDFDIAVILEDSASPHCFYATQQVVKRIQKWCPVPIEARYFKTQELHNYLAYGDYKAFEARGTWRCMNGNSLQLSSISHQADDLNRLAFSEALVYWERFTNLILFQSTTSRSNTRHLIKHLMDIFTICRDIQMGEHGRVLSRYTKGIAAISQYVDSRITDTISRHIRNGFEPFSHSFISEISKLALERLSSTCSLLETQRVTSKIDLQESDDSHPLSRAISLWKTLLETSNKLGILGIRFHQAFYVMVSPTFFENEGISAQQRAWLKTLTKTLEGHKECKLILITPEMLIPIENSLFYIEDAIWAKGVEIHHPTLDSVSQLSVEMNPVVFRCLTTKIASLPFQIRHLNEIDSKEAHFISNHYCPAIKSLLRSYSKEDSIDFAPLAFV